MTNYTELKRLAEAAKLELADIANVVIEDGDLSHHELFQSLASPDVVLGLIKSLEHTTMAAEAEAKEVDERNAVIAGLRTQNQALMEALERMVESVTGVDQVSAVNEARAALTAAKQAQPEPSDLRGIDACPVAEWVDLVKCGYVSRDECLIAVKDIPLWIANNSEQAQPEPVNQVLLKALSAMLTHSGMDEDEWSKPTFDQARAAIMLATTKTQECGMCGYVGTKTDAVGQCPRCHWDELQAQPERAPLSDDEIQTIYLRTYNEGFHGRNLEIAFARAIEAAIKQGGQHD